MNFTDELSSIRALSDDELVARLGGLSLNYRQTMAGILAHLGEVEARRLHLRSGHGSMFSYCVGRLKMSEDEACRRIEVARLARRFPSLLELLAAGQLTLSVAALLRPNLNEANCATLLAAVSHKTVAQAREVLAAWFPRPDVLPSIRKVPTRRTTSNPAAKTIAAPDSNGSLDAAFEHAAIAQNAPCNHDAARMLDLGPTRPSAASPPSGSRLAGQNHTFESRARFASQTADDGSSVPLAAQTSSRVLQPNVEAPTSSGSSPSSDALPRPSAEIAFQVVGSIDGDRARAFPRHEVRRMGSRACAPSITPLASDRYKIQLTAGAELKRKLELSRDLLRHAIPQGDLAAILERALDVLIEKTLERRFGVAARAKPGRSPRGTGHGAEDPNFAHTKRAPKTHGKATASTAPRETPMGSSVSAAGAMPPCTPERECGESQEVAQRSESVPTMTVPIGTGHTKAAPASSPPLSNGAATRGPLPGSQSTRNTPMACTRSRATRAAGKSTPHSGSPMTALPRTCRHIPRNVRRAVLERDQARCTWRGPDGERCNSRAWLEYDHIVPFGRGGTHDAANIRLLCQAHNRLAAEQTYGRDVIARAIDQTRARRRAGDIAGHQEQIAPADFVPPDFVPPDRVPPDFVVHEARTPIIHDSAAAMPT